MPNQTTGAGDGIDAGFISGLLKGMPFKEVAQLANACGALAVAEMGPMAGAQSRAAVERVMRNS